MGLCFFLLIIIFGVWQQFKCQTDCRFNISSPDLSTAPKHFCQPWPTALNWWIVNIFIFIILHCIQVTDWMDFHSMAVLQCYNNRLQELDWSGEAQKWSSSIIGFIFIFIFTFIFIKCRFDKLCAIKPCIFNRVSLILPSGWWPSIWRRRTPGAGCWWRWPWRPGRPLSPGLCRRQGPKS